MTRLHLIAGLIIALCISLGINIAQFSSARVEAATAPLRAQVAALEHGRAIAQAVAAARSIDDAELQRLRQALTDSQSRVVTVYRDRIREIPAPACPPGGARVDAWNSIATEE